jgi:hypothetical protein
MAGDTVERIQAAIDAIVALEGIPLPYGESRALTRGLDMLREVRDEMVAERAKGAPDDRR